MPRSRLPAVATGLARIGDDVVGLRDQRLTRGHRTNGSFRRLGEIGRPDLCAGTAELATGAQGSHGRVHPQHAGIRADEGETGRRLPQQRGEQR